ncbi:4-hydroxythreonine-4-phosphate dehydrogenase PdxA [Magnetospirillum fulvum]|uniref:4-hydroxythreonine-4-phosphate dehydrogenase n=1 Tax=Magnetospirillum fulvum MGU-K5 TaxID=1316936 RepID=S9S9M0_MAGFU|nr:4-hydroxythreonine-4-phosphate dehydrogenase PdxA [Magnetospirillum fulvum]EPY00753.1 pyridoxal phosphate biosynthesis protein [Magnetospirillum fulvum MGU-K5]
MTNPLPPLALTMGEPAGIGGDIALAAWTRRAEGIPPFVMLDSPERLTKLATRLGLAVPVRIVSSPAEALELFHQVLPVLPVALPHPVEPGFPHSGNAVAVAGAIERAVKLALAGEVSGVVTNPIHKKVMYQGGFRFPGHTEFLAALAAPQGGREVMMLTCPGLRVVPVSIHISLAQAVATLSTEAIVAVATVTARALTRDFGITAPRLAVAGLNPHAGEGGTMGREDIDIVAPAVERLRQVGIDAIGPLPADTLFHERARRGYDAVICMYHDQALIPLKTIGFDRGVNVTLGLPVVRTSPDHGTAFDLAGSGRAGADSLIAALKSAAEIAANRARLNV